MYHRIALALLLGVAARATVPTIDESLTMEVRRRARKISPDGRYIAYLRYVKPTGTRTISISANLDRRHCYGRALPTYQRQEVVHRPAVVARFAPHRVYIRPRRQAPDLCDFAQRRRGQPNSRRRITASAASPGRPTAPDRLYTFERPRIQSPKRTARKSTASSISSAAITP